MPRYVIRHATSGRTRTVGEAALPFFRGWDVVEELDDPPVTPPVDEADPQFPEWWLALRRQAQDAATIEGP